MNFAGYAVGAHGLELDPNQIEAVNQFSTPATRQELKNSMGFINQFRQFNQAVTKSSYTLTPFMSTKGQHTWLAGHQKAFDVLKVELAK